ncbi:unnamed protein product [Lymnaea stagnalis]|uniref:Uncharacterized protein n=1 Tax=Lymnaea stagnalis TaxID=6523 RepID=A0AAV2GZ90_LYMST
MVFKAFSRLKAPSQTTDVSSTYDELKKSLLPEDNPSHSSSYLTVGLYPVHCLVQSPTTDETVLERRMANCFLRAFITLLHLALAGGAGFVCVYSIIGWDTTYQCLPTLFNKDGTSMKFVNGLPTVCSVIVFSMSGVCILNFLMSILVNVRWIHTCIVHNNLVLSLLMGAISVFGGSLFTVHYMLWCDSMQQGSFFDSCSRAADYFHDNTGTSMSDYKHKIEVQQIATWALFPLSLFAVLTYILIIRISSRPDHGENSGSYRYLVLREEDTPLLHPTYNPTTRNAAYDSSVRYTPAYTDGVTRAGAGGPNYTPTATSAPLVRNTSSSFSQAAPPYGAAPPQSYGAAPPQSNGAALSSSYNANSVTMRPLSPQGAPTSSES